MTWSRLLLLWTTLLALAFAPTSATARAGVIAKTHVGVIDVAANLCIEAASSASLEEYRENRLAEYDGTSDVPHAARGVPTPKAGQKVYRVYGGDAKPGGASWTPERPSGNFRDAAGLPSGGPSGANNSGRFVIEGTLQDPAAVVKTRRALKLDGNQGGAPEYIIPNPIESGAVRVDRVSGVNPEL